MELKVKKLIGFVPFLLLLCTLQIAKWVLVAAAAML